MKAIMVIAAVCLLGAVGCQPQPVVIQQQPAPVVAPPAQNKETIIIERDRVQPCPPPARPTPPPCPPQCPPPRRPGVNIEIDINKPNPQCSPQHRCGRCDYCRRNGIKIEIGR